MTAHTRRDFIKLSGLVAVASSTGLLFTKSGVLADSVGETIPKMDGAFELPSLPYSYDALEPYIDKLTMEIHHTKHHQAYVNNLNKALDDKTKGLSLENLCADVSKYSIAVRNNAGGHYNHSFFWRLMKKRGGGEPVGKLAEAIDKQFGSFNVFKIKFNAAAASRFGSGWAWLIVNKGMLQIGSTPNQDNPLMDVSDFKGSPVLALDVWEHAYYLKYQNKRADYISGWWNLVNWEQAELNYTSGK